MTFWNCIFNQPDMLVLDDICAMVKDSYDIRNMNYLRNVIYQFPAPAIFSAPPLERSGEE